MQNIPDQELPAAPKNLVAKAASGFDYVEDKVSTSCTPSSHLCADGIFDPEASKSQANLVTLQLRESTVQANQSHQSQSISIDMPAPPPELRMETTRKVWLIDEAEQNTSQGQPYFPPRTSVSSALQAKQSAPAGNACKIKTTDSKETVPDSLGCSKSDRMRDKRFDPFKTWSGRLERQISNLRGKPHEEEPESNGPLSTEIEALPVERYFDALQGPELTC